MAVPNGYTLRIATARDVPRIEAMRTAVGWTAHAWALRLAIEPGNARCVIVDDGAGQAVAVGSGVAYPPIGIVGNMIVMEGHRRRGLGSAVLDAVVTFLRGAGCTRLELYATEEGRPLYERHGFTYIEPASRATVTRDAAPRHPDAVTVRREDRAALAEIRAFDRPRFGGDRTPLLSHILADAERPALVARSGRDVVGYGWLREADGRIGPWVADDSLAASAILAEAFRQAPAARELTTNMPMSNGPGVRWLRGLGADPDPWDGRMALGAAVPRRGDTIFGNTVGALG
jgi:GNAT superfamily N-acetyltransferase